MGSIFRLRKDAGSDVIGGRGVIAHLRSRL
jgi:hypothetical protein